MKYFEDRPDDLLVMDCDEPDKWEKLCPFLGRPVPETPYPHTGRKGLRPLWTIHRLLTGRVPRPGVLPARR